MYYSALEIVFVGLTSKNVTQNEIKKGMKHKEQNRGYFVGILRKLLA